MKRCLSLLALAACSSGSGGPAAETSPPAPEPGPRLSSGLQLTAPEESAVLAVHFEAIASAGTAGELRRRAGDPGPDYEGAGVLVDPRTLTYLRRAAGEEVPDPAPAALSLPRVGLDGPRDVLVIRDGDVIDVERLTPCSGGPCPPFELPPATIALVMPVGWASSHGVRPGWSIAIDI